jgi:hypothetical protein
MVTATPNLGQTKSWSCFYSSWESCSPPILKMLTIQGVRDVELEVLRAWLDSGPHRRMGACC